MAKLIPITQNPERYSEQSDKWVISASPDIAPLNITKGIQLTNLKPLLEVDGIIVKVDGDYLCSPATLDSLQKSGNPHYSIQGNGPIEVKDKKVELGKTIRIIEVNVNNLKSVAEELDIKNQKAGVSFVDYVYEGEQTDGVPVNLLKQINYTLSQEGKRADDAFGVYQLDLGDDATVYNILPLNADTRQEDGSLDKGKLEKFLSELAGRLTRLREDFNMIKEVFYNGVPPKSVTDLRVVQTAKTIAEEDEFPVLYKYTQLVSVQTPTTTPTTGSANTESTSPTGPTTTTPPIVKLKMRKKKDLKTNRIGVYENDPTVKRRGKMKRLIKEGDVFMGYFLKDWEHGQKIWVVYTDDSKTLVGYGIADKNDFVDPV